MPFSVRVFAPLFLALFLARPALAVSDYWDFNADDKTPLVGSGSLQTAAVVVGASLFTIEGYGSGTTLNHIDSVPAGDALSYLNVGYAFSDLVLEFKNLDFSSINDVTISYAFRSTEIFSLTDSEYVLFEYSTDGGDHYSPGGSVLIAGTDFSDWRVISNSFGSALDGASNAAIRISTFASFGVASSTQYDNIQVVPEPAPVALLSLAACAFLLRRQRQHSS